MIRHVVMWSFKEEAEGKTATENMLLVEKSLYALLPVIPQIKKMDIRFDITHSESSADLMLMTEFESVEDLKAYVVHPEHQKVSQYVRKVIDKRMAHDCEI